MPAPVDEEQSIARENKESNVELLRKYYQDAGTTGFSTEHETSENTRLCIWPYQARDGRKWDENFPDDRGAFPWHGASDVRPFQADGVCNELVGTCELAFWHAQTQMGGLDLGDSEDAAAATQYLDWLVNNKLLGQLTTEVELLAQYGMGNRWTALHITWEREVSYKLQPVEMRGLIALAEETVRQDPQFDDEITEMLVKFPAMVKDPVFEEEAIAAARFVYHRFAMAGITEDLHETEIPVLSPAEARKLVKDLRKRGKSEVRMPFLSRNRPCFAALEPWVDIVVHGDTTDIQHAEAIFIREWYSEARLMSMELTDDWDPEFIAAAIKTKGHVSHWKNVGLASALDETTYEWEPLQGNHHMIEILHAYYKQVDKHGVSSVHRTIFSPHFTSNETGTKDLVGSHGLINYPHGEYPVKVFRREKLGRAINRCRSVPELLMTSQMEEKVQSDSIVDLTSIAVVPPLNYPKGIAHGEYRFGPAVQNEVQPGREPKMMDIPTKGAPIAFSLLDYIRHRKNRYFGLMDETIPPQVSQLLQSPLARKFLVCWSEAFQQAWQLCLRFSPDQIERVTGTRPAAVDNVAEIGGEYDFVLRFDVAQLQPDLMTAKLAAYSELLPEDEGGVIDRSALTIAKARMIDPHLAKQLVMNTGSASDKLRREVSSDIMGMKMGNPAKLPDASNDATARGRQRFAKEILAANDQYIQVLDSKVIGEIFGPEAANQVEQAKREEQSNQGGQPGQGVDAKFSQLIADYFKNINLAVAQQDNKRVGRIGVNQNKPQP